MGIETNDDPATTGTNQQSQAQQNSQATGATFTGSTTMGSAPTGGGDFQTLRSMIGLDRVDGAVEPYLKAVQEEINRSLPDVKYERLRTMKNSYAYRYDGPDGSANFFGILFVSTSEQMSQNFVPASLRMGPMLDELRNNYAGDRVKLSDARVILVGYEPEMSRVFEMADTIVRTFNVTSKPEAKNATIEALVGTEFSASTSLYEARKLERALSPHGVAPRMDVAMTISAKIQHNFGRELKEHEIDHQPLGVIGGYAEIRAKEMFVINGQQTWLYRPVFNITVNNSYIPLEGVAMIQLAAFAPSVLNSKFWASQWANLVAGEPSPGLLEEDHNNPGNPYVLKNREELAAFIDTYFAPPVIAFQFQDGRDAIPGMWRFATPDIAQKRHFGDRLAQFFGVTQHDIGNMPITHVFETRYDGVYGDQGGTLLDSRDIDLLYLLARHGQGIDQSIKQVLLGGSDSPKDRAQITATATGSFTPLYLDTLAAVNPDFIKEIVRMTEGRRLTIVDPNSQTEARSFGSFLAGFGSADGLGSIVQNGMGNRGAGLSSVWAR